MASSFPGAIDSFTDPLSGSPLNSPSHSAQHADLNDAVEKVETYMGLVKMVPTVAGTGVTVSSTGTITFSAATSISAINCFNSTYSTYRVALSITTSGASTNKEIRLQFRNASGIISTAVYAGRQFGIGYDNVSVTSGGYGTTYTIILPVVYYPNTLDHAFFDVQTGSTYATYSGVMKYNAAGIPGGGPFVGECFNTSTAPTGLTITTSASTITGTLSVYGYRI